MTVGRGEPWGIPWETGMTMRRVTDDAALAEAARHLVAPPAESRADAVPRHGGPALRPASGDLARTVGVSGSGDAGPAMRCPADLCVARNDAGGERHFAAHCLARRGWWRGTLVGVMNAQYLGEWDVAPRSHPNDGRVDVVDATALSVRQRWQARTRLPRGDHIPHPGIATSSRRTAEFVFPNAVDIWLDGVRWCRTRRLDIEVLPDAYDLAI